MLCARTLPKEQSGQPTGAEHSQLYDFTSVTTTKPRCQNEKQQEVSKTRVHKRYGVSVKLTD